MKKLRNIALVILVLFISLLFIGNRYVNDASIPTQELAVIGDRVLFVFAHPDDKILVAGTLAKLNAKNIDTGIVYLTRREAGPTGGLVPKENLGEERTKEVNSIKAILGIDYLKVFDFPDSGIPGVHPERIKQSLLESVNEFKPTIAVGFDETVGAYGHEDHRLAGLYLHQLLDDSNIQSIKSYYMVTLPEPMIKLALKISKIFQEHYPKDPAKGLPEANIAVNMWKYGSYKRKVLEAHKTQWKIIEDVQPYGLKIHPYLYYRIFDREYYHKVALNN
ncbi:MAG TPA: PIG-L family deacetylase [Eudoraea sp.]|nr:PIG-L family deacetylase [Eudoraea sp.]